MGFPMMKVDPTNSFNKLDDKYDKDGNTMMLLHDNEEEVLSGGSDDGWESSSELLKTMGMFKIAPFVATLLFGKCPMFSLAVSSLSPSWTRQQKRGLGSISTHNNHNETSDSEDNGDNFFSEDNDTDCALKPDYDDFDLEDEVNDEAEEEELIKVKQQHHSDSEGRTGSLTTDDSSSTFSSYESGQRGTTKLHDVMPPSNNNTCLKSNDEVTDGSGSVDDDDNGDKLAPFSRPPSLESLVEDEQTQQRPANEEQAEKNAERVDDNMGMGPQTEPITSSEESKIRSLSATYEENNETMGPATIAERSLDEMMDRTRAEAESSNQPLLAGLEDKAEPNCGSEMNEARFMFDSTESLSLVAYPDEEAESDTAVAQPPDITSTKKDHEEKVLPHRQDELETSDLTTTLEPQSGDAKGKQTERQDPKQKGGDTNRSNTVRFRARVILPDDFKLGRPISGSLIRRESRCSKRSVSIACNDSLPKSVNSRVSANSRASSIISASISVKSLPREVELHDIDEDASNKSPCHVTKKLPRKRTRRHRSCDVSMKFQSREVHQVTDKTFTDAHGRHGVYTGAFSCVHHAPHGFGRLLFDSGRQWYEGDFKIGEWTGPGRLSNAMGDLYKGPFYCGLKHGAGTIVFADGRTFEGQFMHGQMVEGKMTYPDGSIYSGSWLNDMRHGRGHCVFVDESVYVGEFYQGEFSGFGKMLWMDGGYYEGEWEKGEIQGYGKEILPNGNLKHEGQWIKGQPVRNRLLGAV